MNQLKTLESTPQPNPPTQNISQTQPQPHLPPPKHLPNTGPPDLIAVSKLAADMSTPVPTKAQTSGETAVVALVRRDDERNQPKKWGEKGILWVGWGFFWVGGTIFCGWKEKSGKWRNHKKWHKKVLGAGTYGQVAGVNNNDNSISLLAWTWPILDESYMLFNQPKWELKGSWPSFVLLTVGWLTFKNLEMTDDHSEKNQGFNDGFASCTRSLPHKHVSGVSFVGKMKKCGLPQHVHYVKSRVLVWHPKEHL